MRQIETAGLQRQRVSQIGTVVLPRNDQDMRQRATSAEAYMIPVDSPQHRRMTVQWSGSATSMDDTMEFHEMTMGGPPGGSTGSHTLIELDGDTTEPHGTHGTLLV